MAPVRKKCTGQEPQAQPDQPGLPCAMGLRLLRALPGDRACCPRHRHRRRPRHQHRGVGTTRLDRPRYDVRPHPQGDAASPRGHRFPPQRPVTIAIRPSQCGRDGRKCEGDLPDGASGKIAAEWHDGQFVRRWDASGLGMQVRRKSVPSLQILRRVSRCYYLSVSGRPRVPASAPSQDPAALCRELSRPSNLIDQLRAWLVPSRLASRPALHPQP